MNKEKIAISACLLGYNCKYNGGNNKNNSVLAYIKDKEYILVCPEVLGGMPVPREPSEIEVGCTGIDIWKDSKNKVISKNGDDVTEFFSKGAIKTLELIKQNGIKKAILKESSPSCGVNIIYTGEFNGQKKKGEGVTTALLRENGIEVMSEKDI